MTSKKETAKFNDMLKMQRNLAQELHEEINLAANKLLTPNYIEKLSSQQQTIFYQFPVIEDLLYTLIDYEQRFLKMCETRIKQKEKMLKLRQLRQLNTM